MYLIKEINFLTNLLYIKTVFAQCSSMVRNVQEITGATDLSFCPSSVLCQQICSLLCARWHALNTNKNPMLVAQVIPCVFLSLILTIYSTTLFAEEIYPECFPAKSSWDNIELKTVNLSINQKPKVKLGERSVTLTFNKFENFLPQFYGFAFLKKDILNIPKITEWSAFEEQFSDIKLVALARKKDLPDDEYKSYQFTPLSSGTWVIYLVAALNKIPYLEIKQLRISPNVESVRGGSIFSGSSLNLEDPIDYKACVVQL